MLGILAEAALVEAALLPAPRFAGTAMLAGMLAATWAAFQKLFVQYLLYGGTVLDLYLSLLAQAASFLGIPESAGWPVLAVLLAAIAAVGAAGGLLGWSVGREGVRALAARTGQVQAGEGRAGEERR